MPLMGNTGPADAAVETFMRYLAAEVGQHGVRVLGIYTAGVPETLSPEKIASVNPTMCWTRRPSSTWWRGWPGRRDRVAA